MSSRSIAERSPVAAARQGPIFGLGGIGTRSAGLAGSSRQPRTSISVGDLERANERPARWVPGRDADPVVGDRPKAESGVTNRRSMHLNR
jgi:hypothetical protein